MGTAMVERLLQRAARCLRRFRKAMEADVAAERRWARLATSGAAKRRDAAAAAVRRVDAAIQRDKERAETTGHRLKAVRFAESQGEPRVLVRLEGSEPAEWVLGVTWQARRETEERLRSIMGELEKRYAWRRLAATAVRWCEAELADIAAAAAGRALAREERWTADGEWWVASAAAEWAARAVRAVSDRTARRMVSEAARAAVEAVVVVEEQEEVGVLSEVVVVVEEEEVVVVSD